ncbi:MAG: MarR family transcriptional regulator [Pseudonocardia sp.]|nr:MarR family transcriptional regulator [Pseudonocardia sp.]
MNVSETTAATTAAVVRETAEKLDGLLPALRRASVRAVRAREGLPALPEAQVALLQTLAVAGPLAPAHIADRMHLARPTVSNLVRDLVTDGMVERRRSATDGRSALLDLTPRARAVLGTFRAGHGRALIDTVSRLPAPELTKLHAALPALELLLSEILVQVDDGGPSSSPRHQRDG